MLTHHQQKALIGPWISKCCTAVFVDNSHCAYLLKCIPISQRKHPPSFLCFCLVSLKIGEKLAKLMLLIWFLCVIPFSYLFFHPIVISSLVLSSFCFYFSSGCALRFFVGHSSQAWCLLVSVLYKSSWQECGCKSSCAIFHM